MLKLLSNIIENVKDKNAKKVLKNLERMAQKKAALEAKINSLQTGTSKVAAAKTSTQVQKPEVKVKELSSLAKNKLFISSNKKAISDFYKNYKTVFTLIETDRQVLKSPQFAPSQNDALRGRSAMSVNSSVASSLGQLNFFGLYKEFKAQEQLIAKFPNTFLTNKKEAVLFNIFKDELKKLENEIYAVYQRKHITQSFSDRINLINNESKVFADASQLLK